MQTDLLKPARILRTIILAARWGQKIAYVASSLAHLHGLVSSNRRLVGANVGKLARFHRSSRFGLFWNKLGNARNPL